MADCRYVLAECLLQAVRAVQRKAEWARVACRSAISGRSRIIMNSQTLALKHYRLDLSALCRSEYSCQHLIRMKTVKEDWECQLSASFNGGVGTAVAINMAVVYPSLPYQPSHTLPLAHAHTSPSVAPYAN